MALLQCHNELERGQTLLYPLLTIADDCYKPDYNPFPLNISTQIPADCPKPQMIIPPNAGSLNSAWVSDQPDQPISHVYKTLWETYNPLITPILSPTAKNTF